MLGASLVGAFAVARTVTGATAATLSTAAAGFVVVVALRRRGALAVVLGVAAAAAGALWWGLRTSSHSVLPTVPELRALRRSLHASRPELLAFHLPLGGTSGITALCALVGGLVAVAGRTLGIRGPALSLVPATVVVVWSAIVLPSGGAAFAGLVLGGCGLLVLAGDRRPDRGTAAKLAGVTLGLAALTLGWTTVAGSDAVSPGGREAPAVAPSALSLATDLTGVASRDATVELFRADTRVPTYWQVATLTEFEGDRWVADPATEALLHGSTPVGSPSAATDQPLFTTRVTLSGYTGRLLPAPPGAVAASGAVSPVVTPSGVVASAPVPTAGSYTVTAFVPSPTGGLPGGAPPPAADTVVGPLPAVVTALARSITGGQSSPLDKAEALVDFFRSGRFRYEVVAPRPTGVDPLVTFLTQTRTGSCEQFAGAFAVLARASGLASRVAIGFTPGRTSNGVTVVRGADAHAWPQVLVDGAWVSFEPTPQLPSGELSPPGVLGPASLGQANPTGRGPAPPASIPEVTPSPPANHRPAAVSSVVAHPDGFPGTGWIALVLVLVLVWAAVVAIVLVRRRMRRTPVDRVVAAWEAIDRALARRSATRPVWRTPIAHVRALARLHPGEQAQAALVDMSMVATLLQDVTYGATAPSPAAVEAVGRAGRRARQAVLGGALSGPVVDGRGPSGRPHEFADSSDG